MTTEKKLIERLNDALAESYGYNSDSISYEAKREYRILRAIVRAVIPGRQSKKNISDALDKAVVAACRVIRRSK